MHKLQKMALTAIGILLLTATPSHATTPSKLALNYQVGDNFYELKVSEHGKKVRGLHVELHMDRELLAERTLPEKEYDAFIKTFLEQVAAVPEHQGPCVHPFELKAPIVLTRCRSNLTRTAISHLTRTAEFLVYSQN